MGDSTQTQLKLHLGCGSKYIPGFIHIDVIADPHIHHQCTVCKLPYGENSVDLIYASHLLEHFGRQEVPEVLREWHRVLKPSGLLRIAVPDFAACAMNIL